MTLTRHIGRWGSILAAIAGITALQAVPAETAGAAGTSSPVVVNSASTADGRVLVDSAGFSLYDFSGDALQSVTGCLPTNTAPNGTPCTTFWPPLLATGPLMAGPGVNQAGLGTMMRPGIGMQVTYFGEPLYRFAFDMAPGQINGENVTSFHGYWRLVKSTGGPAATRASVRIELSANGPVLDTPTAFGSTRSLYTLSFDPRGGTTCVAGCTAIWPPLLTDGPPSAGRGVDAHALGVITRPEGTTQVTYFGHPLYLFSFDLGAGQPSGQTNGNNYIDPAANGIWNTRAASGLTAPGATQVESETTTMGPLLAANATVGGGTTATLYTFTADTATSSACSGRCARFWPPLLTSAPPIAGTGVGSSTLGTIQRSDGSFQVTFNGHPVYLFAFALDPTTNGNGATAFGGTFNVVPLT
jgi:predicted lipoprotein with Yx(FWY)xxD motif